MRYLILIIFALCGSVGFAQKDSVGLLGDYEIQINETPINLSERFSQTIFLSLTEVKNEKLKYGFVMVESPYSGFSVLLIEKKYNTYLEYREVFTKTNKIRKFLNLKYKPKLKRRRRTIQSVQNIIRIYEGMKNTKVPDQHRSGNRTSLPPLIFIENEKTIGYILRQPWNIHRFKYSNRIIQFCLNLAGYANSKHESHYRDYFSREAEYWSPKRIIQH